ncbi:MAG: hypothetical protein KGL15_01135 [Acidobacteriota bacterium]|nr:hypothetical protein [Acidobacteriota bacterium]
MREAVGISTFTSAHHIRRLAPTLIAAVLAIAYLIVAPTGADLPAQLLRARLFGAEGFGLWNNWWYAGQNVAAYSVLFPPLAWLLTPQLVGALASVGTAAAFEALTHDVYGDEAWLGATWLGAATVTELLSGRLTFALGLCGAALTALLLERRRPRSAAVLACATALASPVAALFAALAGFAGRRPSVVLSSLLPVVALAVAFPQGGYQPFAVGTLWPLLAVGLLVMLLRPGRVVGAVAALYLAGCGFAYVVATPVGSNASRLGELAAGPLVALLLVPRRAWLLLALCAMPLTYLQVHDAITDLQHGSQASGQAFYRPLIGFLRSRSGPWRVEVPFTQGHWESYRLAPVVPLARGWERQTDIADNPLFYDGRLTAARYRAWLHSLAVRYVAVADAPPDYSSRAELRLIRTGLPFLHVAARLRHWTVYAVGDPTALASGAGRLVSIGPSSLAVAVAHPGVVRLRVHWSPYWRLGGVHGCVAPDGSFTQLWARTRGVARLQIDFSLTRIGSRAPRCN